ncbi:polar amino acid transport system substrate-binding protein [Peptostreptococcaceae bacterium pGA-8]|nr:polar amino acid transport system substrate-binding protein [Peptostreptococcaceae bacterium pGA-8]
MRNKRLIQITIAIIGIIICFSIYTKEKYDISLFDYIRFIMPYSQVEKQYLSDKKTLHYGCDSNAPPLSFSDGDKNIEGLIIDYMGAISIECGIPLQSVTAPWNNTIENLRKSNVDIVDMFPTKKRGEEFSFTQPIYTLNGAIATIDPQIKDIKDLNGKIIAVIEGDFAQEKLRDILKDKPNRKYKIKTYDSMNDGIMALKNAEVDAVAGDEAVIAYIINKSTDEEHCRILPSKLYSKNVTLAVRKDDEVLLGILNKTILKLKEKDVLTKAQEKWFGVASPIIKQPEKYNIGFAIAVIAIMLVLFIFLWNDAMKKIIAEKTKAVETGRQNLQTIIDTLDTYLFTYNQFGIIKECNNAVEKLLGVKKSDILNTKIDDNELLHFVSSSCILKEKSQIEFCGRHYSVTKRTLQKSNEETLVVFEDVTNEVLYNKRLRQESKMEAVNHLSAGLAHEIRNPLGIIRNYLFILRDLVSDEIGIQAVRAANISVNRINSLVTNLLNFSKIVSDERCYVDVLKVIESIVSLEEKNINQKGILIEISSFGDTGIWAGEESLKIIFVNLIDNAIESFSEEYDDKRILISIVGEQHKITIKIKDTGKGLEKDHIENIFNPFYTTKDQGTGLGLYMVQSEIKKLNGTVDVFSKENEGTEFSVELLKGELNNENK